MNGKDLFFALSHIEEQFIDEAERCALHRRSVSPWVRAACLCLLMLGLWYLHAPITVTPGPVPSTSEDPLRPEGYLTAVIAVEQMTDSGFAGVVTQVYGADLPIIGQKMDVVFTEETMLLTVDGRVEPAVGSGLDFTGCHVSVEFREYAEEASTITAELISVESENTP